MDLDRFARSLAPRSRRAAIVALAAAALPATAPAATAKQHKHPKSRDKCDQRNWCVDRTQTCGPATGHGKCLVEVFGGNVCGEILFQTKTCADCDPPGCENCVCVLAAGGGDRCNNGTTGYDFICVRPL